MLKETTEERLQSILDVDIRVGRDMDFVYGGDLYGIRQEFDTGREYRRGPRTILRRDRVIIWMSDYNVTPNARELVHVIQEWKMEKVHAL